MNRSERINYIRRELGIVDAEWATEYLAVQLDTVEREALERAARAVREVGNDGGRCHYCLAEAEKRVIALQSIQDVQNTHLNRGDAPTEGESDGDSSGRRVRIPDGRGVQGGDVRLSEREVPGATEAHGNEGVRGVSAGGGRDQTAHVSQDSGSSERVGSVVSKESEHENVSEGTGFRDGEGSGNRSGDGSGSLRASDSAQLARSSAHAEVGSEDNLIAEHVRRCPGCVVCKTFRSDLATQTMLTLEELSKPELLGLIYHEIPTTLTYGHPVQCAACGNCSDTEVEKHGRKWRIYTYVCDRCEGSEVTQTVDDEAFNYWISNEVNAREPLDFFVAGWKASRSVAPAVREPLLLEIDNVLAYTQEERSSEGFDIALSYLAEAARRVRTSRSRPVTREAKDIAERLAWMCNQSEYNESACEMLFRAAELLYPAVQGRYDGKPPWRKKESSSEGK